MFGLSKSKSIHFKKRISVMSRNQRSLYKLIQNLLLGNFQVILGGRAHRIIDVDESQGSRSAIAKGKEMLNGINVDLIIVENEGFRPICAFRMDPRGNESEESWGEATQVLMEAARAAKFPLFVIPILQVYDTASIVARLRTVIPKEGIIDKHAEYLKEKQLKEKAASQEAEALNNQTDPWVLSGGGKVY